MTAWWKDKKEKKDCNIDLRMVVRARQNYFSPKNGKTIKYCTAVRIFNRDRSCKRITELQPCLLCPRHQYCQVQSKLLKVCFFIVYFEEIRNHFLCHQWRSWSDIFTTYLAWIKCQRSRIFGNLEKLWKSPDFPYDSNSFKGIVSIVDVCEDVDFECFCPWNLSDFYLYLINGSWNVILLGHHRWLQNTTNTNTNTNSTHYWMEILTTMSSSSLSVIKWSEVLELILKYHSVIFQKKVDITENSFFSFCKMIFMTFQKSTLDLKSLNICRHIDLLPEFKIMHFDGSWIFKKCALPPAHNFLAIVEIEITFNHQPVLCSLPPLANRKNEEIVCQENRLKTKVQYLNVSCASILIWKRI